MSPNVGEGAGEKAAFSTFAYCSVLTPSSEASNTGYCQRLDTELDDFGSDPVWQFLCIPQYTNQHTRCKYNYHDTICTCHYKRQPAAPLWLLLSFLLWFLSQFLLVIWNHLFDFKCHLTKLDTIRKHQNYDWKQGQ